MIHLILGGARSGKSTYAENTASTLSEVKQKIVTYIATGTAGDNEMENRIAHHQNTRPKHWSLIEEPLFLSSVLTQNNQETSLLLIDCLTLWINNHLCRNQPQEWEEEKKQLLQQVPLFKGDLIIVSNEVGSGIVPLGELSRNFVDESGRLHQQLAQYASKVTLVVAGLPLSLKPNHK